MPDYVLQRALTVAEGEQKEQLISKVRPHLVNMRRYSSAYSKHLSASKSSRASMCILALTLLLVERLLEKCSATSASGAEAASAEGTKESA